MTAKIYVPENQFCEKMSRREIQLPKLLQNKIKKKNVYMKQNNIPPESKNVT